MVGLRQGTEEQPALLPIDITNLTVFPRAEWAPQRGRLDLTFKYPSQKDPPGSRGCISFSRG